MSNEIATIDYTQLPSTAFTPDMFKEMTDSKQFLSRIQLYSKGKAIDTGQIPPGNYGIPGEDSIENLGDEIDVLIFGVRAKAMDVSDLEDIRVCYNQRDPEYTEIVEGGGMYGPSFLVWERTKGAFYEMFFANKSARKVSAQLYPYAPVGAVQAEQCDIEPHGPLAATLGVRYTKNKKGSWHVTTVEPCKVPFTDGPDPEEAIAEVQKFYNPDTPNSGEEDERGRTR